MEKDVRQGDQIQQTPAFLDRINAPLTYSEGLHLSEQSKYYESLEGDNRVFDEIESLRNEVEPLEGWKRYKEAAKGEIEDLPDDILDRLNEKFIPYIKNLPAGHGRGHLSRDFVGLALQLRDPEFATYDSVEVLVGTLAGLYHDIGNSVVGRYDDGKRFSGHAEVGAHVFGEVAGDDLPPNLKKLVQYAIAAHTNYLKDLSITRGDQTRVRKSYKGHSDIVSDEDGLHKTAIWMARNTDRLDLLTPPFINIRHFATKVIPTMDFDGDTFHAPNDDEIIDFQHQFKPVIRSDKEREQLSTPQERTRNVLEHLALLSNSALYGKFNPIDTQRPRNDYNKFDSEFYTGELVVPAVEDQMNFLEAVVQGDENRQETDITSSFERFYSALRLIEPAHDTPFVEDQFRRKFATLTQQERSKWSAGFDLLLGEIDASTYNRVNELLKVPALVRKDGDKVSEKVKIILDTSLQPIAYEVASQYRPGSFG